LQDLLRDRSRLPARRARLRGRQRHSTASPCLWSRVRQQTRR
jgi:hypothetical protein